MILSPPPGFEIPGSTTDDNKMNTVLKYNIHGFLCPGLCDVSPFGQVIVFPGRKCGSVQVAVSFESIWTLNFYTVCILVLNRGS